MLSYPRRHLRLPASYANVRSDNFPVPPTRRPPRTLLARRAARLAASISAASTLKDRVVFSGPRRWAVCAAR